MVADTVAAAERALGEARVPIHILLTTQFGNLNENQEEMLGAAQVALDQLASELRVLRTLAEPEIVEELNEDRVARIGEILRDLEPQLRDQSARSGVILGIAIQPGIAPVRGSVVKLRDAIRLALADEIRYAIPGSNLAIDAMITTDGSRITIGCGIARSVTTGLLLAKRLLSAQGATLSHVDGVTTIDFSGTAPAIG
jgi:hypothetical protein